MRAVVTGATGFVGSHLVELLRERGDDVVCLVRDLSKAARIFANHKPETILGDLSSEAALRQACEGADLVFHLAGVTSARSRAEFFTINEDGTRRLAAIAAQAAPQLRRFVYVSSLSATGPSTRGHPVDEATPNHPVSAYGASKLAGEKALRTAGLPWTIVRPSLVYGPRDTEVGRLFKMARWGVVPVVGTSEQELSVIHVRDLANGLISATHSAADTRSYFASHPKIVTSTQLVREIHSAVTRARGRTSNGTRGPLVLRIPTWATRAGLAIIGTAASLIGRATLLSRDKGNELLAEAWTCSSGALSRDTGWQAEVSLAIGLGETARWYQANGWL